MNDVEELALANVTQEQVHGIAGGVDSVGGNDKNAENQSCIDNSSA